MKTTLVSPIALGTWVLGGMFQGGIDEKEAIATIHHALDQGICLIDTAPLYGFGRTESLVGKALKQYGNRNSVQLATKCGLGWTDGKIYRDARKKSLLQEIDDSLQRLGVETIDLYQLHWPDPLTPPHETAEAFSQMLRQGKVRAIGLSNCTLTELQAFEKLVPIQAVQPAFNLFEQIIDLIPHCKKQRMQILGYGTLCRGLLSGKLKKGLTFRSDDLRSFDPKFQEPLYSQYLNCVEHLQNWVQETHNRSLLELAFRWVMDQGVIPLWGPENRKQLFDIHTLADWKLTPRDLQAIDRILARDIPHPIGIEFLAPPSRS
jgi:aryl-alcohol dehydrogenase-like predicted oxidoreductase